MSHTLTFYPVGNGDTSLIKLKNGKWLLFDYNHQTQGEDTDSPIINLKQQIRDELNRENRNSFDVVAITHGDDDHIRGSSDLFELDHAKKYQGDDRIKIAELWVPAALILEEGLAGKDDRPLRQEARYRLKEGYGIKVFSKPDELKSWLEENDLSVDERRKFIIDAGEFVPNFTIAEDGIEFFCHAPFIEQIDDEEQYRNNASLIFHATFDCFGTKTKIFMIGDADWDYLEKVYQKTNSRGRTDQLDWNLYFAPHHCSYKGLSDKKGKTETQPTTDIEKLLKHGQSDAYIVVSCNPIDDDNNAHQQDQPPHIQAKKCYEKFIQIISGRRFLVTMEYPNRQKPAPMIFTIDSGGIRLKTQVTPSAPAVTAPRAGRLNGN